MLSLSRSLTYRRTSQLIPLYLFSLIALMSGCGSGKTSSSATILVAAAADLAKVSRPLAREFERTSGVPVTFGFGSSAQLEQQIRQGASFDVYAPAARSFCVSIERDGLAEGSDKQYAIGRLVVWSKTIKIQKLDELKDSRVQRIAIANPRYAPYGVAAQQALQNAGMWQELQPKIVFGENVAHTLQMAETGNVEFSIVAMALVYGIDGFTLPVDTALYQPIQQAAVVLKASKNKQAASAFVDFLLTPQAQGIFKEYGFASPGVLGARASRPQPR